MVRGLAVAFVLFVACATAVRSGTVTDGNGSGTGTGDGGSRDSGFQDANGCSEQPCSVLPQCGCGSGSACDLDGSDHSGTACRMITAPGHETSSCASATDCDADFICLGDAAASSCHEYCGSDADCGSPRGACVVDVTYNGTVVTGIPTTCSSNCDPLASAATYCPSTDKCAIFTGQMHAGMTYQITDCEAAGAGTQGGNCKSGTDGDDELCAAGNMCTTVDGGTSFQCRKLCNKGTGTGCSSGTTCIAFSPAIMIAGTQYGVCN
jgi:hypothetical protein